jgi:flavin-dependent dehydrogenase
LPALIGVEVGHLGPAVRQAIASMVTFVENDAPDVQPDFRGTMLDRARFDALLVERALAAGATCRFGTTVRNVADDGCITLSNGDALRARVLIGADGPRSIVGDAIGSRNVALVETRQVTAPLLTAHEATDIFLSDAIPGGYGWLFPKGDVANIGAGVVPQARAALKSIVDRLHRSLVEAGRVGQQVLALTGGLIPVGGMVEPRGTLGATHVLLAGDAAGLANPVTGAGIAAAVYSGKLAGEAASVLAAGHAHAAHDYAEELEGVFGAALARALRRREELAARAGTVQSRHAALRRGWIAYPEYWAA